MLFIIINSQISSTYNMFNLQQIATVYQSTIESRSTQLIKLYLILFQNYIHLIANSSHRQSEDWQDILFSYFLFIIITPTSLFHFTGAKTPG